MLTRQFSRRFALLGVSIALAASANAQSTATTETPTRATIAAAKPKPKPKDDEMICKMTDTTGTRLGAKKVCYTRGDWAVVNANAYQAVNHSQLQNVAAPSS